MREAIIHRNNIKVFGNGVQPMLMAHGFGCDQHMWRYITPAFEEAYKIILFDYVGSGGSDKSAYNKERYSSLQGYAQDIVEIIEALDLKDIVFVGHSVSSMTGMLAAIEQPGRFSKIVMLAPSPCYINKEDYVGGFDKRDIEGLLETMDKNYIGWANFLAPAIMANPARPELGEELKESFCSTDPVIARQFAETTFFSDNRNDLKKLKVPSLIMQCSEDIIAPLEVGKYMAEHMPGSTLKILNATGHCPQVSAPEETVSVMHNYLYHGN